MLTEEIQCMFVSHQCVGHSHIIKTINYSFINKQNFNHFSKKITF
jgi:hypothetical protein